MSYRHTLEVRHNGLGKCRVLSGSDYFLLKARARAQSETWENEYQRKLDKKREVNLRNQLREERRQGVESKKLDLESKRQEAEDRTSEAEDAINKVKQLLVSSLGKECSIKWEKLKNYAPFPKKQPPPPIYSEYPSEPREEHEKYQPKLTLLDKIFKSQAEKKKAAAFNLYLADHAQWVKTVKAISTENKRLEVKHASEVEQLNKEFTKYNEDQSHQNEAVDRQKANYEAKSPEGIKDYFEIVLEKSEYPEGFPFDVELEYASAPKILIANYTLPAPSDLPQLKEVKYVKSRDELVEVRLLEKEINILYDNALYRICLRAIHELFDADIDGHLASVAFNGCVKSIDRATGKRTNGCILSIHVQKNEFQVVDLANVDPRTCFKALKGVGSSQLHSLTPIAPVMNMSHEDKRFVPSHEVADQIDERFNLASMDWEDFEQLVREIFEKEFNQNGGEVKVTRASRDGGVDAVAFDPDPIHGGKIVIQAKRYTNTVGVAFVRELWGTVMNEGAMKGILITTADYGPDAYDFAKGKPLVLMNGANLLYLLEKHGRKAKIDIKEAKQTLGLKDKWASI